MPAVKRADMAALPFFFDLDPSISEIEGNTEAYPSSLVDNANNNEDLQSENITESKVYRFNVRQQFIEETNRRLIDQWSKLPKNHKKQGDIEKALKLAKWKVCKQLEKINERLTPGPGQSVFMVTVNFVQIDPETAKEICKKIIRALQWEYWVRFIEPTQDGLPHFHMLILAKSDQRYEISRIVQKIREKIGFYSGIHFNEVEYSKWKRPRPDWWPPLLGYCAKFAYNLNTIIEFKGWLRQVGQDWFSQAEAQESDEWDWDSDESPSGSVPSQHHKNAHLSPTPVSASAVPPSTSAASVDMASILDGAREPLLDVNSFDYLTTTAHRRRAQRLDDESVEHDGRNLNDILSQVVPSPPPPPLVVVDPLAHLRHHPAFDDSIPPSKEQLKSIISTLNQQKRAAAQINNKETRNKEHARIAAARREVETLICIHYPTDEVSKFRGRVYGLTRSLTKLRDFPGVEALAERLAATYQSRGDLTVYNLHPTAQPVFGEKRAIDALINKIKQDISTLCSKQSKVQDKRKALQNIRIDLKDLAEFDHWLKVARVMLEAEQIMTSAEHKLSNTDWPTQGHIDLCYDEIENADTKQEERKWRAALKAISARIKMKKELEYIIERLPKLIRYHRKITRQGHWLRTNGIKKSWSKISEMLICHDFVREETRARHGMKAVRKDPVNEGTELGALREDHEIQRQQDRAAAERSGVLKPEEDYFEAAA